MNPSTMLKLAAMAAVLLSLARPCAAQTFHPVGSSWPCRACGPDQECYRQTAEFTVCRTPHVQTCSISQDGAWPPLVAFENLMNQIAAHYDMTRPNEGLRVMKDILLTMGFASLLKNAPLAMRAVATRVAARSPSPAWSWMSSRVAGAFAPLTSVRLPPGVTLPAVLRATPRPLYLQEEEASCGLACVKMVVETIKRTSLPESWYRALARGSYGWLDPCAYRPGLGTEMSRLATLLRNGGVSASLKTGQQVNDLIAATRNGYPAIVGVGQASAGHAIIVDGLVQDTTGNWFVLARDPWNLNLLNANGRLSFQQLGFRNYAVYSLSDFLGPGGWSGYVVYTSP